MAVLPINKDILLAEKFANVDLEGGTLLDVKRVILVYSIFSWFISLKKNVQNR